MMKTTMVLLVPSVMLLANLAFAKPNPTARDVNVERMFELAGNYTASLPTHVIESFVEGVEDLASKCQHRFFCKVEKILTRHNNFGEKEEIVQILTTFNKPHKEICDKKHVGSGGLEIQLGKLLDHLKECIRQYNMRGGKITE